MIRGSGGFLPGAPVSNEQLIRRLGLDTTDEWLKENVGLEFRHLAPPEMGASDLGARAAEAALADAGLDAADLDHILFCSSTADWTSPAAASNVQRLLGATCPAEDKNTACAGFVFGVDHAARLLATGAANVLVVAGEVKSRFVRKNDRKFAPIFADGAAAWVLSRGFPETKGGLLDCILWTDGTKLENMITPAGGSAMPASRETLERELHTVHMNVEGREIARDAVHHMARLSRTICERNEIRLQDVNFLIPHQANLRIMEGTAAELGLDESRVIKTIHQTGNIVSATLPYSYDFAVRNGVFKPGMMIVMTTVGAGYAGGALLYRMPE